jgi:hypothetical protein
VEDHHDDCGHDLTGLQGIEELAFNSNNFDDGNSTDSGEENADPDHWLHRLSHSLTMWSIRGSEAEDEAPPQPAFCFIAADASEMITMLSGTPQHWGVDIVEVCGGAARTTYLCVRRQLTSGHNFELLTGCDLNDIRTQVIVWGYFDVARPLVTVMAPTCSPFGPFGRLNRVMAPDGWRASYDNAAPHGRFCGHLALRQSINHRYYLNEQPQGSTLYQEPPWPQVRAREDSQAIVFHQCMVGQRARCGRLARKSTELVANHPKLLKHFENLKCNGRHEHADLTSGACTSCRVWTWDMCGRISQGIVDVLKEELAATNRAYPNIAVGDPAPAGADAGDLSWRKCPGCRWRVERTDVSHTRVPDECKYPMTETIIWDCESCRMRRPRDAAGHNYLPGQCRHASTVGRRGGPRAGRHPRPGHVPADTEPTSGLEAAGPSGALGEADEAAAARAEAASAADGDAAPGDPPGRSSSSSSSTSRPPADAESRRRGPDLHQRERRSWADSGTTTVRPTDWTSFDVQSSLRGLRMSDEGGRRRILRKLHLRWWHATAAMLTRTLRAAGMPKEVLDLIPSIVSTCAVCRLWTSPGPDTVASVRVVQGFGIEVEGDLLFFQFRGIEKMVFHCVCRCTRWQATTMITGKDTGELLDALDRCWITIFGPMKVFHFDGELGLDNDAAEAYFQLKGIQKRTAAVKQHVRTADRRVQVLRSTIHKIETQLNTEAIDVTFQRILSEATFVGNAMTNVHGITPYNAVLGRQPALLPDLAALPDDTTGDLPDAARAAHRIREVAIMAMVEGTARDRLKRASRTQTRPSGEQLDFKVNDEIEYWRDPATKDIPGWRGPGVIVDVSRIEHGRLGVRTSSDNVITCRIQDVRHRLMFMALFMRPGEHQGSRAGDVIRDGVERLASGKIITLGIVKAADGQWLPTADTAKYRNMLQAALFTAEVVYQLTTTLAVRFGHGVRSLTARDEFANSLLVWWYPNCPEETNYYYSAPHKLSVVAVVGERWPEARLMQLLLQPEALDLVIKSQAEHAAREPAADLVPPTPTTTATPARHPPGPRPLEAIPEGTEVSSTAPSADARNASADGSAPSEISPSSDTNDDDENDVLELNTFFEEQTDGETRAYLNAAMREMKFDLADKEPAEFLSQKDITEVGIKDIDADQKYLTQPETYHGHANIDTSCRSQDDTGYVDMAFFGDTYKLLADLPHAPKPDEIAVLRFFHNGAKKAIIERDTDLLTVDELRANKELVVQAMYDELVLWHQHGCFSRRERQGSKNIIDTRWVFKWKKVTRDGRQQRIIRARLTVRGFKDTGAEGMSAYAGTASRWAQRLVVSEAVLRGWPIVSADVAKAFLQGITYRELAELSGEPEREVNFTLPPASVDVLKRIPGFASFDSRTEVLHCDKPGTGLRDAPKCFALKLRRVTHGDCGMHSLVVEPELEVKHVNEILLAMLCKHVDDLKIAASRPIILEIIAFLERVFGKLEVQWHEFTNCGIRHRQNPTTFECELDQVEFIAAIKPIQSVEISGAPADQPLSDLLQSQFFSLLMTLAYALMTRVDLCAYVAALQKAATKATILHVRRLNALVRWAQRNPKSLCYRRLPCYPDSLVQVSDSAFKADGDSGLSLRGIVSLRMNYNDLKMGDAPCHIIDFGSRTQRHVTRATFSSELYAGTDSVDAGLLQVLALHEVVAGPVTLNQAKILRESGGTIVKLVLIIDAMSVHAAVSSSNVKTPAEQSLLVHIKWLRACLDAGLLYAMLWADTRSMLADGMTKGAIDRSELHRAMECVWRIGQEFKVWRSPLQTKLSTG